MENMDVVSTSASVKYRGADYKSPTAALARFFCQSRDRWKAKAKALKIDQKRLQNRIAYARRVEERRKAQLKELESQLIHERSRSAALERQLAAAALEKKRPTAPWSTGKSRELTVLRSG
jgi:hypothetical protein